MVNDPVYHLGDMNRSVYTGLREITEDHWVSVCLYCRGTGETQGVDESQDDEFEPHSQQVGVSIRCSKGTSKG